MPRSNRVGGPTALALCLSLIAPLTGCGGGNADELPQLGGGPIIRPAEPGQSAIPDPDRDADSGPNAGEGGAEVPVADEPESPGIGS